jgi:hypothetical protein
MNWFLKNYFIRDFIQGINTERLFLYAHIVQRIAVPEKTQIVLAMMQYAKESFCGGLREKNTHEENQ